MNHETYVKLVAALSELAERDRPATLGICTAVIGIVGLDDYENAYRDMRDAFRRWPLFSGDISFPVPHPTMSTIDSYYNSNENWDTDTEYGRNRWALLAFLLEDLAKGRPQI